MPRLKDGFRGERAIVLPRMIIEQMESDPLTAALHITDMGYYPHASHHYRSRPEGISQYVLLYCIDGSGWFSTGGKKQCISANQYVILPAGEAHEYGSDKAIPWTIYWIHFKGTLAASYSSNEVLPVTLNPAMDSRITRRIDIFEEMFATLKMGYSQDNMRYVCSLFHHYLGSLCYWVQYRNAANRSDKDLLSSIIHYMNENIERRVTLAEVASFTGYSPSHFLTIFTAQMGQSPISYLNQLKIQRACHLLDFSDMKINQVCFKVGIKDPYYFSRLFKQIMGCSPKEYRQVKKG